MCDGILSINAVGCHVTNDGATAIGLLLVLDALTGHQSSSLREHFDFHHIGKMTDTNLNRVIKIYLQKIRVHFNIIEQAEI